MMARNGRRQQDARLSMKVYSTGVFDVLHKGHINVLLRASELGELIVGLQNDEWVTKTKGMPILTEQERKEQLEALPFVKEVILYGDPNQVPQLEKIKPDIMVQGDDWLQSGDRLETIAYMESHKIKLVLVPRTRGISSTEIRRRVAVSGRRDMDILKKIKLMPIHTLSIYEQYDLRKVARLIIKIIMDGYFFNPITIAEYKGYFIVVDGANRLEALRRLQVMFVPCLVLPYEDIELTSNTHYIKDGKVSRASEFIIGDGEKREFQKRTRDDILELVKQGKTIPSGETWHKQPLAVIRLRIPLQLLFQGFNMEQFISEKARSGNIRYYPSNVYIFDEWE